MKAGGTVLACDAGLLMWQLLIYVVGLVHGHGRRGGLYHVTLERPWGLLSCKKLFNPICADSGHRSGWS